MDKKGVLSYPNPTAEKIFFLRNGQMDLKHQTSVSSADPPACTQDVKVDVVTKFTETGTSLMGRLFSVNLLFYKYRVDVLSKGNKLFKVL